MQKLEFQPCIHQIATMIALVPMLLITFLIGFAANRMARKKGRDPWIWTIASILLIFPLIILLLLPATQPLGPQQAHNA